MAVGVGDRQEVVIEVVAVGIGPHAATTRAARYPTRPQPRKHRLPATTAECWNERRGNQESGTEHTTFFILLRVELGDASNNC